MEENMALKDGPTVALACFSQRPRDSRSACIVALDTTGNPEKDVAACRTIGAPVVLVCWPDHLQWWKLGSTEACGFGPEIPLHDVEGFFIKYRDDLAPQTIYRAKTLGRIDASHQREFVDLGLMPMVEQEAGRTIERLLLDQVSALRSTLQWPRQLDKDQAHWLLKSVFWLLGAKMLHDKEVDGFIRLDFSDVEQVFERVARHYGLSAEAILTSPDRIAALQKVANAVAVVDLGLTTTEALAYVYENTLISKEVRKDLGTHSTPAYLIDYIVGRLAPWIAEIPADQRHVFEPTCGHSGFLVAAVRLLTSLLPPTLAAPRERKAYLRQHISGCDVDAFALEIARLSLTLTDIPNPNGWKLIEGNVFVTDTLEEQAERAMIVLSNPPFESIKPEDREAYTRSFRAPKFVSRAAEILHRTLKAMPVGGVFGFIVPQTLLHGQNATQFRKLLVTEMELAEICLFPDSVFNFGKPETAVLIGRKIRAEENPANKVVRYRRIRPKAMDAFRSGYEASSEVTVFQECFLKGPDYDLRVPDLENIWAACQGLPKLNDFVEIGQGFSFIGEDQPDFPVGSQRTSTVPLPGFEEGFENLGKQVMTHRLPPTIYMNMDEKIIRREILGRGKGKPQIICANAPIQSTPWCAAAMMDAVGHVATTRFNLIRSKEGVLGLTKLWALINSPIANAFAYCHSTKRDILTGTWRKFPVPDLTQPMESVETAVENYLAAVSRFETGFSLANDEERVGQKDALRVLHWRIDAEVLKLYKLPVELERQLLDYFAGHRRAGVPFQQDRYFPEGYEDFISLADYLAITADWEATNNRRLDLIDKKLAKTLTDSERVELADLKRLACAKANLVMPLPHKELAEREADLKRRGLWRGA
ncbi:MAG: N-6 DNA methylase [Verrucomicrobiota bacterium]